MLGEAPIPHADMHSLRGYCLSAALPPSIGRENLPSVDDEMVQGAMPWTISSSTRHVMRFETGPVARYRSPSRAIVVRYRSTSLLAKYARSRRRCPTSLTSPRVKVVFVGAQVIGKSVDPLGEESNLNFGRTSVLRMRAKLSDDRLFLLGLKRHFCGSLSGKTRLQTQKNRALLSTQPGQYSIRIENRSFWELSD